MAKGSQAERRRKQLERAVRGGDLDTVRGLLERSPEKAAHAILDYVKSVGSGLTDESWIDVTVDVSSRLRSQRRFDLAAVLTNAMAAAPTNATAAAPTNIVVSSSPRLRFEQALAAFGLGDDARAHQLAAEDDAIAALLGPCLALARGEQLPKTPAQATQLMRGVHGICRAAAALDANRAGLVRAGLRSVTLELAAPLGLRNWQLLGDALTNRNHGIALAAAAEIASLESVKHSEKLRAALGWELGRRYPARFIVSEWKRLSSEQSVPAYASRAAMTLPSDPVARLRAFLEQGDVASMDDSARATAALYQTYFLVADDTEKVERALNHAVALGADMGEVLRVRWLAARTRLPGSQPPDASALETAAKAAERLAHLLERQPDGHAFRALLLGELGVLQERSGQYAALAKTLEALEELERLHDYADAELGAAMERFELVVLASRDPHAALERLEPKLTENNRDPALWELAIALQHRLGLSDRFEATVLRAAELSVSSTCVRLAKPLYRKRRLADAGPAAITPGLMANELRVRFAEFDERAKPSKFKQVLGAKDLERARGSLSGEGRTAYDVAVLSLLSSARQTELAVTFATDALASAAAEGRKAEWIGAGALLAIEFSEQLSRFATQLTRKEIPSRVVEFMAIQVVVAADPVSARHFMTQVARLLDASAVKRVVAVMESRQLPPGIKGMHATVREAARLLHPEYDPLESWERRQNAALLNPFENEDEFEDEDEDELEDEDEGEPEDDGFDAIAEFVVNAGGVGALFKRMPPGAANRFRELLGSFGIPKSKLRRLSTDELAQAMDIVVRTLQRQPSQQSYRDMVKAFSRFGFTPEDFPGLRAPGQQGRKSRGSSTCPF